MSGGRFAGKRAEEGQIFIVRHAQSAANAGGRSTDSAIIPITSTGAYQAQSVADLVSDRPRVIAGSRYLRTVQTAEPLPIGRGVTPCGALAASALPISSSGFAGLNRH
jgi:hypothetical protein